MFICIFIRSASAVGQAYTWWGPKYLAVARPTDCCYGDCAWGLDNQPHPLSVAEWITALLRREELETPCHAKVSPTRPQK